MKIAKHISPAALAAFVAVLGLFASSARARVDSEIESPDKRHISVERAMHLAKIRKADPLPDSLFNSFAPPGFDLTDAEEAAAAAEAARLAAGNAGPVVVAPPTDRELLDIIASKISPSGTVSMGGHPMLMFGKRFVKTGAHFTVTYKGIDYDLELTEIDGTNFTLRYNRAEITRPVKPAK
jgi:hypothetical protein